MFSKNTSLVPLCLLFLYVVEAALLGIAPVDRSVWWAENITAWIPIGVILLMYWRGIRFSNTAYCLMFIFFVMHTIGGHYTFEQVPIDAITWTIKSALKKFLSWNSLYASHRISAKLFLYFMTEIGHFFSVLLIFP